MVASIERKFFSICIVIWHKWEFRFTLQSLAAGRSCSHREDMLSNNDYKARQEAWLIETGEVHALFSINSNCEFHQGMAMSERKLIWAFRVLAVLFLLCAWWLAALMVGRNLIPTPFATWQSAMLLFAEPDIYKALGNSLYVYLAGMLIAVSIGLPLGLLAGGVPIVGRTLDPFFNALMATPRVAFIPLIIVLLGLGFQAKIAVVALGGVMPILINTYAGVRNGDEELVEMARSAGATSMQVFVKILMPGAASFIMVGLRLGATVGLINTVVAELYTAVQGLGGLLATYGNTFRMGPYFVVVITLAVIGVCVTELLRVFERRLDRWRRP